MSGLRVATWTREGGVGLRGVDQVVTWYIARDRFGIPFRTTRSDLPVLHVNRHGERVWLRPAAAAVPVNWQSAPTIPAGSTDYMVPAGNYLNEDPSKPLFNVTTGRKVYFTGPGRMKSAAEVIDSTGARLFIQNYILEVLRPTVYGKSAPRLMRGRQIKHLQLEDSTITFAGLGIVCDGSGGVFAGDYTTGDALIARRLRVRGIDGRRSNGAGGYIRSGISPIHYNNNQSIRDNGGVIGYDIANFIQLLNLSLAPITWEDLEILLEPGMVHEDIFSLFGGSGARAEAPGVIRRNLIELVSRWDWNSTLAPGSSAQIDGMVTANADSYQPAGQITKASDTGIILGDSNNLSAYARNTSYVTVSENWVFGTRPCLNVHSGHHLSLLNNRLALTDRHRSGVLYSGVRYGAYEAVDYASGQSAADNPGEPLWGHHTFDGNAYYTGSSTSTGTPPEPMTRNGPGIVTGIQYRPALTDGGEQWRLDWNAGQAAAGRSIGAAFT